MSTLIEESIAVIAVVAGLSGSNNVECGRLLMQGVSSEDIAAAKKYFGHWNLHADDWTRVYRKRIPASATALPAVDLLALRMYTAFGRFYGGCGSIEITCMLVRESMEELRVNFGLTI